MDKNRGLRIPPFWFCIFIKTIVMYKNISFIIFTLLLFSHTIYAQNLSGAALLDKAIKYHDPDNNWPTFNSQLKVTMHIPNRSSRISDITINLPQEYFKVRAKRDTVSTTLISDKGVCSFALNGSESISQKDIETHNLTCERTKLYKNYYTYLYGLPMKLKDPGTNISESIEKKQFKGKTYLVLKATYDKHVGSDIWYFYFNPNTYAMEAYQFFKTNENGHVKKGSGEYILLTQEKMVNGVKIPKNRSWYYNKNDKLLGTDVLD